MGKGENVRREEQFMKLLYTFISSIESCQNFITRRSIIQCERRVKCGIGSTAEGQTASQPLLKIVADGDP